MLLTVRELQHAHKSVPIPSRFRESSGPVEFFYKSSKTGGLVQEITFYSEKLKAAVTIEPGNIPDKPGETNTLSACIEMAELEFDKILTTAQALAWPEGYANAKPIPLVQLLAEGKGSTEIATLKDLIEVLGAGDEEGRAIAIYNNILAALEKLSGRKIKAYVAVEGFDGEISDNFDSPEEAEKEYWLRMLATQYTGKIQAILIGHGTTIFHRDILTPRITIAALSQYISGFFAEDPGE